MHVCAEHIHTCINGANTYVCHLSGSAVRVHCARARVYVCKRNVNTIRTVEMNKRRVKEIEMQKKRRNTRPSTQR